MLYGIFLVVMGITVYFNCYRETMASPRHKITTTTTLQLQPFYGFLYFVREYLGELVPCLQPSSLRGLATPCTSCLHLTRSSEYARILSNAYPVHWKMLSIHVVFGLPLFRDPGVVPCIICFCKLSELLRITCPKYVNFLAFTDSKRFLDTSALSSTQSFVHFAVHDTRSI